MSKEALFVTPVLRLPNFSKPFLVNADASNCIVGAAILQTYKDKPHHVAYFSKNIAQWRGIIQHNRRSYWQSSKLAKSGYTTLIAILLVRSLLLQMSFQLSCWFAQHNVTLSKIIQGFLGCLGFIMLYYAMLGYAVM